MKNINKADLKASIVKELRRDFGKTLEEAHDVLCSFESSYGLHSRKMV